MNKITAAFIRKRIYKKVSKIFGPVKSHVCVDCGKPAKEWDHYLGYDLEHELDVQAVCYSCHKLRGYKRGELTPIRMFGKNNPMYGRKREGSLNPNWKGNAASIHAIYMRKWRKRDE